MLVFFPFFNLLLPNPYAINQLLVEFPSVICSRSDRISSILCCASGLERRRVIGFQEAWATSSTSVFLVAHKTTICPEKILDVGDTLFLCSSVVRLATLATCTCLGTLTYGESGMQGSSMYFY